MKFQAGNTVLLYNGKTVYIVSVDKEAKKYLVVEADNCDNNPESYYISESSIYMFLT